MAKVTLQKEDIVNTWQKGGWREAFYDEVELGAAFQKAFLRSVRRLVVNNINRLLVKFSQVYFPGDSSDVKIFQRVISTRLSENGKKITDIQAILEALGETKDQVDAILCTVERNKKVISSNAVEPKNIQLTDKHIYLAWENGWQEKFEEFVLQGMGFQEALLKSARELGENGDFKVIKETALRYSSQDKLGRGNFVNVVVKALRLTSSKREEVISALYKDDKERLESIINTINQGNKQRAGKLIGRSFSKK